MLRVCSDLFNSWNEDVRYCHWKSNEHLMEGLDGETDLDVFVFPDDKIIAESHLRDCYYIKFAPQKSSRYPMVDEWIGFDRDTGKLVHVHLHYQIITGTKFCKEYFFPVDNEIIESRILDNETKVYLSSPEIELIILYSRIVLKSKYKSHINTKGYDDEISYLKKHIDKDCLKEKCQTIIGEKGEKYYKLITADKLSQADWNALRTIIQSWLGKYRRLSSVRAFVRTNFYWAKLYKDLVLVKYFHKPVLAKKTFPHSKISICFLGQDGSGKSTLSQNIEKWLRWKIDAHRFYLGSGEHYKSITKWVLSKVASLKRSKDSAHDYSSTPRVVPNTSFKSVKNRSIVSGIVAILSSHDLKNVARRAYKEVIAADKYSQNGAVSLFDRFPQNQFPGIYDGPKIRSLYLGKGKGNVFIEWFANREERYINLVQRYQPSLVFKLMLSPEESIRRKPFENFEQVSRKHIITEKLVFDKSEVHTVDATQDYAKELLQVKNLIWDFFLKNQ